MIQILGVVGALILALASLPQALKSIVDGHSNGLSHGLLWMWFVGEILMLIYSIMQFDIVYLLNYMINLIFVLILLKYKYYPTRSI